MLSEDLQQLVDTFVQFADTGVDLDAATVVLLIGTINGMAIEAWMLERQPAERLRAANDGAPSGPVMIPMLGVVR